MSHVNFTELRANMAAHFDRVAADRSELVVTRQNHEPVVIVALSEWERMVETIHVLGSPASARELLEGMAELDAGKGEVHELVET